MNGFVAVDASVALKWVLTGTEESAVAQASALLEDTVIRRGVFVVPPHFFAEVTNVLYQRVATQRSDLQLTPAEAAEALATLRKMPLETVTPPGLYERALKVSQQHKLPGVYDALYVVVAELAGCDLWTDDRRLLKALNGALPYVKWIRDYRGDLEGGSQGGV
jgi:predicted nucleic acid-binding protein